MELILCNAGHFDVEVDVAKLGQIALKKEEQRKNIMGYLLPGDRWVLCPRRGTSGKSGLRRRSSGGDYGYELWLSMR